MTTPNSLIEYDMTSKDKKILKETEVLGGDFEIIIKVLEFGSLKRW